VARLRPGAPHWIIPAISAMRLVSEDGYVRTFNAGTDLATINLTPRAVRADYPIYKRGRIIMDEERVRSAIEEAGCELSRISVMEHLKNTLATERVSCSSEAPSLHSKPLGVTLAFNCQSSPTAPNFFGITRRQNSTEFATWPFPGFFPPSRTAHIHRDT
jgi:hypothetical protein